MAKGVGMRVQTMGNESLITRARNTIVSMMMDQTDYVATHLLFIDADIGFQAQNIYMESDFASYLPRNDPTLILWEEINDEFQLGSTIVILINQEDRGFNDVRYYEVLNEMDEIYRVLYENPSIEGKDTGIASILSLAVLSFLRYRGIEWIEWGFDISLVITSYNRMIYAPWAVLYPSFMILISVLSFLVIGDSLTDIWLLKQEKL